jgi:PEP-CTERM motif
MIFNKASRVVGALATMFLLHGAASAASVGAGQFNLSGTVYITNTSFLFGFNSEPTATSADELAGVLLPATGAFSGLTAGAQETIHNLLTPGNPPPFGPGPVQPGSPFTLAPFVELTTIGINADLSGPNPLPQSSNPTCSGTSFDAPGSICQAVPGSPVTLEQGTDGVTAIMNFSGRAYFVGSTDYTPLSGKFSANFSGLTISTVLSMFSTDGFLRTSYSANFTTTPSPTVPEPASMALIGAGLLGLGILGKKKLVK